jgi:hypothetical protein
LQASGYEEHLSVALAAALASAADSPQRQDSISSYGSLIVPSQYESTASSLDDPHVASAGLDQIVTMDAAGVTSVANIKRNGVGQKAKELTVATDRGKKHVGDEDDDDEEEEDYSIGGSPILNKALQRDSSTKEADPSGRIFRYSNAQIFLH